MSQTLTLSEKITLLVTGVVIAGVLAAVVFFGSSFVFNSSSNSSQSSQQAYVPLSSLSFEDTVPGAGDTAELGDTVLVDYMGSLRKDGTKFDSSYDRGEPFKFTLGAGQVIQGWDQGVAGMKVGGKRTLEIPSALGYGAKANGPIPANSDLVFVVELLEVTKGAALAQPAE